jgi:hypothetical protein
VRRAARFGGSWRTGLALYAYFSERGAWTEALAEMTPYVKRTPSNRLNISYATALVRTGRLEEAVAFLEKTAFLPSEHGDNASAAWIEACRRLAEKELARLKEMGLDGIESLYQANTVEENIAFTRLADKLKLMKTAGSDFHGSNKANITLGMEVQESFIAPFLEAVNLVK